MKNNEEIIKEFDDKFGDNVVWWQECIAEMRIGDPDFNRLKDFIRQKLSDRDSYWLKKIEEGLPHKATEDDGWESLNRKGCCPGDDWADGYKCLSIIKKDY